MKVSFTAQARADRNAIFDYLVARSPAGARNVAAAIERVLLLIGEHPESGSRTRRVGTRVMNLGDYPYASSIASGHRTSWSNTSATPHAGPGPAEISVPPIRDRI